MIDHTCRAGQFCRGRVRSAEEPYDWIPAQSREPNNLCKSCFRAVEGAVSELFNDVDALSGMFTEPTAAPVGGSKAASPAPAVPVNVFSESLAKDIRDTVERCAEGIADVLHTTFETGSPFSTAMAMLQPNIETLLQVPWHEAMEWNRAGDDFDHTVKDGPQLALELVDLHRRARAQVGKDRGRDRMPVPCPRCEESQLGRWHGGTVINCLACGSSWPEEDYKRLTLVLSSDYEEFRPQRAKPHLARQYQTDPEAMRGRRI